MAYHNRQRQPYAGIPHAPEDIVNRLNVFSPDVLKGPAFVHPVKKSHEILDFINNRPDELRAKKGAGETFGVYYDEETGRVTDSQESGKRSGNNYEEKNYIKRCGLLDEFKKNLPKKHLAIGGYAGKLVQIERSKSSPDNFVIDCEHKPDLTITETRTELGTPYLEFLPYTTSFQPPHFCVTDIFNRKTYSAPLMRVELDGFEKPNYRGIKEGHPVAMALQIATSSEHANLETRITQTLDKSQYPNCVVRGIEHAQRNWIYFPNWVVPFSKTFTVSDKAELYRVGEQDSGATHAEAADLKTELTDVYECPTCHITVGEADLKCAKCGAEFDGVVEESNAQPPTVATATTLENHLQLKEFEGEVEVKGEYVFESFFGKFVEKGIRNALVTKSLEEKLVGTPQETYFGNLADASKFNPQLAEQESGSALIGTLMIGGIIVGFIGGIATTCFNVLGDDYRICGFFMLVGGALGLAGLFAAAGY
ncbi:MAG: hypothetical protein V1839_03825 [archaeon]